MGHDHSSEEFGRAGSFRCADRRIAAAGTEFVTTAPSGKHANAAVKAALLALRIYKLYFSVLFAGTCRFEPTCSVYAYQAIERFGVLHGSWLALKRLLRCHPLSRKFGYDPVPERENDNKWNGVVHTEARS